MKYWMLLLAALILILPAVHAEGFGGDITDDERHQFDQILVPLAKIYNFVKYAATAIAIVVFVFAGIKYIVSGNDTTGRDTAKSMATYTVIGLLIIWAAPFVVQYLVG